MRVRPVSARLTWLRLIVESRTTYSRSFPTGDLVGDRVAFTMDFGSGGGGGGITNIGGGDDIFHRYKMPRILGKVEGRGNGIKTRIVNCSQIAKALHRPPGYVCKFFGCELGAQTKINDGEDVYIVNGSHDQKLLTDTLNKFIQMYVLCPNCKLPETDLVLDKKGNIYHKCNACGAQQLVDMTHRVVTYMLNHPPDGHATKKSSKSGLSKKDRKELKKKKADKDAGGDLEEDAAEADGGDADDKHEAKAKAKAKKKSSSKRLEGETAEQYRERRAAEKSARRAERHARKTGGQGSSVDGLPEQLGGTDVATIARAAEQAEARLAHQGNGGRLLPSGAASDRDDQDDDDAEEDDDDDEDWCMDTSKEAQTARAAAALGSSGQAAALASSANATKAAEPSTEPPAGGVCDLALQDHAVGGDGAAQTALEALLHRGHIAPPVLAAEACRLFGQHRAAAARAVLRAIVIRQGLPDAADSASPAKRAPQAVEVLRAFRLSDAEQAQFLEVLDELAVGRDADGKPDEGSAPNKLWLASVPHILKLLYDEDVVDESAILAWHRKQMAECGRDSAALRAREAAQPVITWLQQDD